MLADAPVERRATLLEHNAFAKFLVERIPVMAEEWQKHRAALHAAGELPEDPMTQKGTDL
jgi:hypothetical protein